MARPTKYKDEFAKVAESMAKLGATDIEIADALGIEVRTLYRWKAENKAFCQAVRVGKEVADARIERSLYARANGYEHDEVDIRVVGHQIIQTPIRKFYPPDTTVEITRFGPNQLAAPALPATGLDYLENGGRHAELIWHRRSARTKSRLHRTACAAFERVAGYWHMLPEASQARKAIWDAVNPHSGKRRIDEAFPQELRKTTRNNEMQIEFKNGSTWQVVGSDNFNSLVGSRRPASCIRSGRWQSERPRVSQADPCREQRVAGVHHHAAGQEPRVQHASGGKERPGAFAQKLTHSTNRRVHS
jgi:hypothetical protein